MRKKRLLSFISLVGCLLASCSFRNQQSNIIWSKWHDNGDGTHSRHALNDITIQETDVHHFSLLKTNIEPTDVAPGKATYSCDECAAKEDRVLPPTGNYVFDQKVVAPQYLYEKCSEHSAIYYMSSKEGAYGNPEKLFEVSDIGDDYTEVDVAHSDGSQYINTGVKNTTEYSTITNYAYGNNKLPNQYVEVEYIESTGVECIDTGINSQDKLDIEIDYKMVGDGINQTLFGAAIEAGTSLNLYVGGSMFQFGAGSWENALTSKADKERHKVKCHFENQGSYFEIDGTRLLSNTNTWSPESTNIYLFSHFDRYFSKMKLYSCSMSGNGTLLRDFVPCYDNTNHEVGLYDLVTADLFTNAGTGGFLQGEIIYGNQSSSLPDEYQEVEYIKTTGTQYIDTGVNGNNSNLKIEVTYESSAIGHAECNPVFIARSDSSSGIALWTDGHAQFGNSSSIVSGFDSVGKHKVTISKDGLYYDGAAMPFTPGNNFDDVPLIIAKEINDGRTYSGKIYSFKVWNNDVLIRDLIPSYRKSNSEVGLFDLVNTTFYENSGTGDLGKGNDITHNKLLPSSYIEVEYVESTGTQYLDTEVAWVNGTALTYEITLQFTTPGPSKGVGHHRANVGRDGSNNIVLGSETVSVNSQEKHTYKIEWEKGNYESSLLRTGYVDGVEVCSTHIQPLDERNFFLFACTGWTTDDGKPPYSLENVRIFETKFYRDGNLIKHFVPAYYQNSSEYGMYETIEGKWYENQGTGKFIGGEVVSSNTKTLSKYSEVEFIKFDGTQYIDTHIAEDAVWHFDLKWECSGERELMGYGGSSSEYFGISATGYYAIWDPSTIACGNRDNLTFTYSTSEVSLKVNDVYACQFGGHSDIQLGSFLIGGLSSFNTVSYQNTGLTLFSVQAYSGETLLASYKPAIDNSTGKAGLYDLVTNEFLGDVNGGTFKTGAIVGNIGSEIAQETEDLDSIEPVALPVSYHQLAYINVAGYHTIPTKLTGELKIDMVANFKNVHASQSFGYNADTTVFSIDKNGKYYPTEFRVGNKDTISLDVGDTTENKYTATLNGTKIIDSSFTFKNKKDDLKLFSINGKGGVYGKVYSLKIFKKNVLKMNLVPVKNIYLNEIGFYDTVSESFLTSSNNVEFTGGSDMNVDIDMSNINMFISRYSNEKILQKADMSDFKVFNSKNELIRDFVPALRNSDGKLGFFEVVEKKFYESPIGNEFTYDNKVGHLFGSEKTLVSPTHSTNGEKETVCKICGRHVHEKIDRTAYQVTFQLPSFIQTVKIFQELDPSKYEIATVGYTRNVSTYNYSKVNAWICFEVVMDEDITLVVTASNGKVRKLTNTKYEITNIVHDCVITIAKKA